MAKLVRRRSKKTGLPPGSLVHIGERKSEKTRITVMEYDGRILEEKEMEIAEGCYLPKQEPTVTWISVEGIQQVEVLEKLGSCFGLHPLVQEDIMNTDQRPKIEDYGEDLFIVIKRLFYDEGKAEVGSEQISLILRPYAVLSFQEREESVFAPIRERLRNGRGRLRQTGADYLMYALLDVVVDHYFIVLEKLGEKIEVLEEKLLTDPGASTLGKIQDLKREMLLLRKWVWPLREVISSLERGEFVALQETTRIYLRDVYDHTIQVMDTIEILRDMLSGMVDIYLSSLNNRMNAVMKVLTLIATIFMPLSFITGLWGMNFRNMTPLEWAWGFPATLILMAAIAVFMLITFRRKKWL
jgi:magnesium transporter